MLLKLKHIFTGVKERDKAKNSKISKESWVTADRIAFVIIISLAIAFALFG